MRGAGQGAACEKTASRSAEDNPAGFLSACAAAFCMSTAATIYFCRAMSGGMEMPGGWTMSMMWMRMPGQTWFTSAAMFLVMWLAMMVAMMLPSAMPMLRHYRRWLTRNGGDRVSTLIVAGAYFGVWMAIGAGLYIIGVAWALATMRWSGLSRLVPVLTGITLVVCGVMQLSRWKMAALGRCRDPLGCAGLHAVGGGKTAFRHGLNQGVSCAICCAAPMLVMVALGAMNPAMMVIVALVIAIEKLAPRPDRFVRFSGVAALIFGVAVMLRPMLVR